jgi:hypothetical protein
MFSLVKYLYYGNQKVEDPEVENVIVDNEPEIIDSYVVTPTATATQTEIFPPKATQFIMPPFMQPTIEKCYNSSFVNPSIFPKQTELSSVKPLGNLVKIPYV